jgi:hypothetical protein
MSKQRRPLAVRGRTKKKLKVLYPKVHHRVWKRRHGMDDAKTVRCPNCGLDQPMVIPFETSTIVGLLAEMHACGPRFQASTGIDKDPKRRAEFRQAVQKLMAKLNNGERP